jgi:hypothetical protein
MAYRIATMSPADTYVSREPSHLFRKLVLLFLLGSAAALGMVLLQRQKPEFPALLFSFFADVSLGVVSGMGVRTVLRNQGWFVRGAAAAAVVVVALGLLGYFTDWKAGIGPLEFGRSTVDWLGLTHMAIGIDTAWITTRAWSYSAQLAESAPRAVSRSRRQRPSVAAPRVQLPRGWSLWPKPRPKVRTRAGARGRGGSQPAVVFTRPQPASPRRSRGGAFRRRPQVQLALVEDHRCPYCLDPVLRTDARGVKECEVCHTLHHADCWAITGTCQVPHLNT